MKNKIVQKTYFDVKVEALVPATLTYRVLAEDENQALDLIKNVQPTGIRYKLIGKKNIKAMIYMAGTSMIKLVKNFGR